MARQKSYKRANRNLLKLAAYLFDVENLKARFDMWKYCDHFLTQECSTNCGSVGCAIGHGPYAGVKKYGREDFAEYCQRVFKIDQSDKSDEEKRVNWIFLFDSYWRNIDNSSEGAAKRILYFLDNNRCLPVINYCSKRFIYDSLSYVRYNPNTESEASRFVEEMVAAYQHYTSDDVEKIRKKLVDIGQA